MTFHPDLDALFSRIYEQNDLDGLDRPLAVDPLRQPARGARPNSVAIGGGAFGDEGKGRIVDVLCSRFAAAGQTPILVYRWNGGANAGHTVVVGRQKIALHQLPSGALHPGAVGLLGKGMVIHPADLVAELESLRDHPPQIKIDEMAVLALDTHRAYEVALKTTEQGGQGATGRGISPAYADVLYRHAMRMRDLASEDWEVRLGHHYDLYAALLGGLDHELATVNVPALHRAPLPVGARAEFLARLAPYRAQLLPYIDAYGGDDALDVAAWWRGDAPVIFEGAQAVGLDSRFGVYPDITASDPTFGGITGSTEGIVLPHEIAVRAAVIKATYTSSVGTRRLPTMMEAGLAGRIRDDAHEYGATTRRPRDIAHIDLPCLRFFMRVGGASHLILTHLDIAYPELPIKVCTHYLDKQGRRVGYRPDQSYLDGVTPIYRELPSWAGSAVAGVKRLDGLPKAAMQYIAFLCGALAVQPLMVTTGAERDALITWF